MTLSGSIDQSISFEDLLRFYAEAGSDAALEAAPIDQFSRHQEAKTKVNNERGAAVAAYRAQNAAATAPPPKAAPSAQAAVPDSAHRAQAQALASEAMDLESLKTAIENFEGCNLKFTAKNMVFAEGNPNASLMLIGEAPGREEDVQGAPFMGHAGQLLDRMLQSIGQSRESVYLTNIIPWRPPGNRTPTAIEISMCLPFITRQIELVQPTHILMLGGASTKALLDVKEGIMRLRGKWHDYALPNGTAIKALPTLQPDYLLRNPAHKRHAWFDLLQMKAALTKQKD